jgi:hypothetical protein
MILGSILTSNHYSLKFHYRLTSQFPLEEGIRNTTMAEKAPPQDGAILQVPISIIGGAETLVTEPLSRVASEAP